ncbi:MAG: Bug family tripartite tricarboxylate transporter substrate binding protein [Burkholderiales bacterium]
MNTKATMNIKETMNTKKTKKTKKTMDTILRTALALTISLVTTTVTAQSWPAKPIRVIVPNAPGASPDLVTRLATERLSRLLNTPFVVENNTAGSGVVAAQSVSRAAPDGYSWLVGTITSLAINPNLMQSLPYRPEDFVGAAMIYDTGSQVVAVHPDVPAKTLAEFFALAKAQPGKLSYAADRGLASILGEWMHKTAGVQIALIPYKVPSQSLSDTAGGRLQEIIISIPLIDNLRKAGKLRVLAVSSAKRFPLLPEVPTVGETLPGFVASGWSALVAPAGTPPEILIRLNRATDQVVREAEYQQRLLAFGLTVEGAGTLEWIGAWIKSEREKWGKIIRDTGIKPE